jgi:hypothetical protein
MKLFYAGLMAVVILALVMIVAGCNWNTGINLALGGLFVFNGFALRILRNPRSHEVCS